MKLRMICRVMKTTHQCRLGKCLFRLSIVLVDNTARFCSIIVLLTNVILCHIIDKYEIHKYIDTYALPLLLVLDRQGGGYVRW